MKKVWTDGAWEDYLYWQKNDRALLKKINDLIRDTERNPFSGLGKPEPLKEGLAGWWSRRITGEHRLVYRVTGSGDAQSLEILACRYHY
ncbi:Txe/YoeB family addiction module toxin [Azospirillum sp. TSA6c]|uniref:Txe/YoeB family addiction module toxin n=1 Tax=Azospirillum sp. TSA6c TaxID=709813 RepID=UPI000D65C498|nr:Txe/YoeB family addiction module toxin [Azospirillum sp. TSA6c]